MSQDRKLIEAIKGNYATKPPAEPRAILDPGVRDQCSEEGLIAARELLQARATGISKDPIDEQMMGDRQVGETAREPSVQKQGGALRDRVLGAANLIQCGDGGPGSWPKAALRPWASVVSIEQGEL